MFWKKLSVACPALGNTGGIKYPLSAGYRPGGPTSHAKYTRIGVFYIGHAVVRQSQTSDAEVVLIREQWDFVEPLFWEAYSDGIHASIEPSNAEKRNILGSIEKYRRVFISPDGWTEIRFQPERQRAGASCSGWPLPPTRTTRIVRNTHEPFCGKFDCTIKAK